MAIHFFDKLSAFTLPRVFLRAIVIAFFMIAPISRATSQEASAELSRAASDQGANDSYAPEIVSIGSERWTLNLELNSDGARLRDGAFGEIRLQESELFRAQLLDVETGARLEASSSSHWKSIKKTMSPQRLVLRFSESDNCPEIAVELSAEIDERGVSWRLVLDNASTRFAVEQVATPKLVVAGAPLNLFVPDRCGRVILNAAAQGFHSAYLYPDHIASMQFFAFWGERGGIYAGAHDPVASMKTFVVDVKDGIGTLETTIPAVDCARPGASFTQSGETRWEAFEGDWFDATALYKDFVETSAQWLPEKGRPDVDARFKEIPFWICDYIPNSEKQGDARPMTLATVSERFGKDYWVDAAIQLRERLGVPIGYQVYNWHEIPFNINYPHFLPARPVFLEGLKKLKDAGVYVFPYINAVSWEMDDAEEGFELNFADFGIKGAALNQNNEPVYYEYPQIKSTGRKTRLAPMCPGFQPWREIVRKVAREIEATAPVDGIYFDQVSAVAPTPCRSAQHEHLPGGGSWWSDKYNLMMATIAEQKPASAFYYSESNAEPYAKTFDGFLTWIWTKGDLVPAFPAIYSRYIVMLGRYTDGATRDDDDYFRFHLAQALLFGQQLGWINACVVYNDERMAFLEKLTRTRYELTDLFVEGTLRRPPRVRSNLVPKTSSGIVMEQVLAGVWTSKDETETTLLVVNVSSEAADAVIELFPEEYGVDCPNTMTATLEPQSVRIYTWRSGR
ncbi:MAG: DUF6259 domain-containing protein [Planctomycetia bacterium]|nr:DUF6259 domain-containing protein [Planctomycetia bacterium]